MASPDITPGEWEFVEGQPGFMGSLEEPPEPSYPPSIWVSNAEGEFELAQLAQPLYSVEPEDEYDEGVRYCGHAQANGLLMAAAPDLLAALIKLDSVSQKRDEVSPLEWYRTIDMSCAAIAKATGSSCSS